MSASMMMLTSLVAAGLGSNEKGERSDYDYKMNKYHPSEGSEKGDMSRDQHKPLLSRLLLSAAPADVDMGAISAALQTVASTAMIHPLYVCPITACPDDVCPPHDQLTASGCIVNDDDPKRAAPLQAGTESVLDFVVITADPNEGQQAIDRIDDAITEGEFALYNVMGMTQVDGVVDERFEERADGQLVAGEEHRRGDDDDDDDNNKRRKLGIIIICAIVVVIALLVVLIVYCCCCKRSPQPTAATPDDDLESQTPSELRAEVKNIELNQSSPDC